MTTHTLVEHTQLVTEECCTCGVLFAMPDGLMRACRRHSQAAPGETKTFCCPNGHPQSYIGRNREQELKDERDRARDRAAAAAAERDQAEASARAFKGAATRARKRAAAAVCPCCHRSFKQLRRHMRAKHPDYVVSD